MDKIFMNNDALASGIATIISDYRKGDVNHKFDTSHVLKWVDQFDESERNVVLRETFHILSYYYFKEEKIIDILKNFLEKIQNQFSLEKLIFINCQDYVAPKGASQGILLKLIKDIFEKEYDLQCCIKNDNYYDQIGDYIYIYR
ncbi:MAG: hypothetical protein LUI14_08030 [Lachnospiraceae bacterium]|nr:hypothetical protein [Lachnospiraceae bacterium]